MGQAFDEDGRVLGEACGPTKRDVFELLMRQFPDAHRVNIESVKAHPAEFASVGGGPVGSTMSAAVRSVGMTPESPAKQVETEATAIRRYVETIVRAMEANGRTPARVWVEALRAAIR